ncbi:MAG: hypothetical protein ABSC20_00015 [Candidatus Bathyarchaeia archaeon]
MPLGTIVNSVQGIMREKAVPRMSATKINVRDTEDGDKSDTCPT